MILFHLFFLDSTNYNEMTEMVNVVFFSVCLCLF